MVAVGSEFTALARRASLSARVSSPLRTLDRFIPSPRIPDFPIDSLGSEKRVGEEHLSDPFTDKYALHKQAA